MVLLESKFSTDNCYHKDELEKEVSLEACYHLAPQEGEGKVVARTRGPQAMLQGPMVLRGVEKRRGLLPSGF